MHYERATFIEENERPKFFVQTQPTRASDIGHSRSAYTSNISLCVTLNRCASLVAFIANLAKCINTGANSRTTKQLKRSLWTQRTATRCQNVCQGLCEVIAIKVGLLSIKSHALRFGLLQSCWIFVPTILKTKMLTSRTKCCQRCNNAIANAACRHDVATLLALSTAFNLLSCNFISSWASLMQ